MRDAIVLAAAICSAVAIGCGAGVPAQTSVPTGYKNGVQPAQPTPEETITKLETPEDRAIYLRQLGSDSSFEPQKHVAMLEKCSRESSEEVAGIAKELLERK